MRVYYRCVNHPAQPGLTLYQQGRVDFCCIGMCRWWGRLIGFGARSHPVSTNREVNLFTDRPQPDGSPVLVMVPIDFCPFCGEIIEVHRVK